MDRILQAQSLWKKVVVIVVRLTDAIDLDSGASLRWTQRRAATRLPVRPVVRLSLRTHSRDRVNTQSPQRYQPRRRSRLGRRASPYRSRSSHEHSNSRESQDKRTLLTRMPVRCLEYREEVSKLERQVL